jgi:hypothetical protein
MISPEAWAGIAGAAVTWAGAVVAGVRYFVRAEMDRLWLRLHGEEGFLPRREARIKDNEIGRRLAALEEHL